MKSAAYQANHMEFNPLYEKMKSRFCQNGTVAEQLLSRARSSEKSKVARPSAEYNMTHANSLPKAKKKIEKRSFFTLKSINTACMLLLIAGTVLFSGAAVGSLHADSKESGLHLYETKIEDSMILNDAMPWENANSDELCEELSFSF